MRNRFHDYAEAQCLAYIPKLRFTPDSLVKRFCMDRTRSLPIVKEYAALPINEQLAHMVQLFHISDYCYIEGPVCEMACHCIEKHYSHALLALWRRVSYPQLIVSMFHYSCVDSGTCIWLLKICAKHPDMRLIAAALREVWYRKCSNYDKKVELLVTRRQSKQLLNILEKIFDEEEIGCWVFSMRKDYPQMKPQERAYHVYAIEVLRRECLKRYDATSIDVNGRSFKDLIYLAQNALARGAAVVRKKEILKALKSIMATDAIYWSGTLYEHDQENMNIIGRLIIDIYPNSLRRIDDLFKYDFVHNEGWKILDIKEQNNCVRKECFLLCAVMQMVNHVNVTDQKIYMGQVAKFILRQVNAFAGDILNGQYYRAVLVLSVFVIKKYARSLYQEYVGWIIASSLTVHELLMIFSSYRIVISKANMAKLRERVGKEWEYDRNIMISRHQTQQLCQFEDWLFNNGFTLVYVA